MQINGIIIKGVGGIYNVEAVGSMFKCKARGIFRKDSITPLAGDSVIINTTSDDEGVIEKINERRNSFLRPAVANIDKMFILASIDKPKPSVFVIDKLTAIARNNDVEPIIIITKSDLGDCDELEEIYLKAGFKVFCLSNVLMTGFGNIEKELTGCTSVFTGNTGVGKSSLLNNIYDELNLATGEISDKLGRGRHTTRQVELFKVSGGYVADTPGFSSVELENDEIIIKENLQFCFGEFSEYLGKCKFSSCLHITDKGCKIIEAVENGTIPNSRHESYIRMYNEVKDLKEWEMNRNNN